MRQIELKEIQELELKMLIDLDKFCRKNKIDYFLGCGTLAGAILRKNFFPWDDDIDVLMKREDYEKFINSYNGNYKLLTCNNRDYYYPYAKMVDTRTIVYECKNNINNYGVFIDIFPLDIASGKVYLFFIKILRIIMMSQWGCYLDNKNIFIKIIYKILSIITNIFPKNYFASIMNNICKNKRKGNLMGVVCFHKYNREIMDRNIFDDKEEVIFSKHKFYGIKRYEEYLNNLYIDYKKEDNKEGHKHFRAYWR